MPEPKHDHSTAELRAAVAVADRAADGDSNDAEIDALRNALTLALTRWPELNHTAGAIAPATGADLHEITPGGVPQPPTAAHAGHRTIGAPVAVSRSRRSPEELTHPTRRPSGAGDELASHRHGGPAGAGVAAGAEPAGGRLTNRDGLPRLAAGQLTALVLQHMRTYPHLDFSPYELGKVLGRSHGTVRRILERLSEAGTVTRTRQRPAQFRITT